MPTGYTADISAEPLVIVPHTQEFENVPNARISYCYLHGKLENDARYDCFGFGGTFSGRILEDTFSGRILEDDSRDSYIRPEVLSDGIYPAVFNNKPCTFYYWNSQDTYGRHRGLVVYNDDTEAVEYARDKFINKESHL